MCFSQSRFHVFSQSLFSLTTQVLTPAMAQTENGSLIRATSPRRSTTFPADRSDSTKRGIPKRAHALLT